MNPRLANSMDIKRRNLTNTLRCILSCEHISLLDLSRRLSLSVTSVLQNVKMLAEMGLVREVGSYESTGGRKAKAFAPICDARMAVGLDLTRNHVSAVLINLAGKIEHFHRERLPFCMDDAYLRNLGELVARLTNGVEEKALGVGVSLPGIVDNTAGILRYSHILGLDNVSTKLFCQYIPFACAFINDANSAGMAEVNGLPGADMLVYLSLSNSVGGAIFKDGALYEGRNLRAGEFGHLTLVPDGRPCYCGKKGCMDAYCAASLLADRANGSLDEFFRGVASGKNDNALAWRECLYYLAIAVNNINMALDSDVIIGGYLGAYMEEYGGDFGVMLKSRNPFHNDSPCFRYCQYKKEAAAVGAALMFVNRFIQSVSLP